MRRKAATALTGGLAAALLLPLLPASAGVARTGIGGSDCPVPAAPLAGATKERVLDVPGLSIRRSTVPGRRPLRVVVATANVGGAGPRVRVGPLVPAVLETKTLAEMLGRAPGVLAAVNGDFFDWGKSWVPYGPEVLAGGRVRKGVATPQRAFTVSADKQAAVEAVHLSASVQAGPRNVRVQSLNSRYLPADGVAVLTPAWGSLTRRYLGAKQGVREVVVRRGRVSAVNARLTSSPVPADGFVVVAQGSSATALAGAVVGSPMSWSRRVRSTKTGLPVDSAIGVGLELVVGGKYLSTVCSQDRPVARTILGVKDGGRTVVAAVVDGRTDARTTEKGGLSVGQSTRLMKDLGVTAAVMLDGGGSANMIAQRPGGLLRLTRSPDGWERKIPNGYAFGR